MELHPDRNYENVEETTKKFAEVQSAYEILADPQERAWYDTHRVTILRNEDDVPREHYAHNVRITTAQDISRIFTRFHGTLDLSDSTTGFYGVLRETFDTIAREERLACEWEDLNPVDYPPFGHADDEYEDTIKPFYAIWNGFATKKTFSWEDVYRYSEAPDRRVRRMMEKENKRFREEGTREFNDAVRSLVAFVKKRDPRFKPNVQTEAERQKVLKDAAVAQAARSRAANKAKHVPKPEVVPEWMKPSEVQEENNSDEAENTAKEQFECVVCNKNFKSEKQYEAHEKSRKHVRAVQHTRRQLQQEDKNLNLEDPGGRSAAQTASTLVDATADPSASSASEARSGEISATEDTSSEPIPAGDTKGAADEHRETQDEDSKSAPSVETSASSSDDEYTTREKAEDRILGKMDELGSVAAGIHDPQAKINDISERLASESLEEKVDSDPPSKLGKAKQKRAKKAAQKSSVNAGPDTEFKCASCQAGFPSKSRLYNHLKDFGHATSVSKPNKGGKGKNR